MDTYILYLCQLNKIIVFILNLFICITLIGYCFLKIDYYNSILNSKKSNRHNYAIFAVTGSLFAVISYLYFMPVIAYFSAYIIILVMCKKIYFINWQQNVFLTNDFLLVLALLGNITPTIISILRQESITNRPSYFESIEIILAFVFAIIMVHFFDMKIIKVEEWRRFLQSKKHLTPLIIFQYCVAFVLILNPNLYEFEITIASTYYQFFGSIIIGFAYRLLLDYVVKACNAFAFEIRFKVMEEQLERHIVLYNRQVKQNIEIRKFKHDCKSLLEILNQLIEEKRYSEMKSVIEQTDAISTFYFRGYQEFSNNVFIQAILFNAYQFSLDNKINLSGFVVYPDNLRMKEIDICRIFSNLIGNAIDACNNVSEDERFIIIKSKITKSWLTVILENSYNGNISEINGTLYTTKECKDEHGLGTQIIEDTVSKYNGLVRYDWDDSVFTAKLHIPFKKQSSHQNNKFIFC